MKEKINVKKSFDVANELKKASVLLKCEVKALDFEVLEVYTTVTKGEESRELSAQEAREFFQSREFENEACIIAQSYDLCIWVSGERRTFELELDVGDSRLLLSYEDNVNLLDNLSETHRQINAQKALLKVLFKDFSSVCDEERLESMLKNSPQDKLLGKKKILLEQSGLYSPVVDSHFFFTLEKEWELKNHQIHENSSYASKGGEEAGRLIKAKAGRDGRNLLGEFVKVERREPVQIEFKPLEEDFLGEEMEDCVIYRTLKDGFVGLNTSGLLLIKEFVFEEITHRNIGNLLGGVEKGFEISVKSSSVEKDAIGASIILEAQKISVNGGVDQGVILRAKECQIDGLTHQGAEIIADRVEVATHKGYLRAIEAEVKMSEGGIIECENAKIDDLVGSEVYCKEAKIQTLHANNRISFCGNLEIENAKGGKNDFKIEGAAFGQYRQKIKEIEERYQAYSAFIDEALRTYKREARRLAEMEPAIKRFKQMGRDQLAPQDYMSKMIGQYEQMHSKLKIAQGKILEYQSQADAIRQELEPISKACMDAKLICRSAWVDQNQVEYFDLYHKSREILVLEAGEQANILIENQKLVKERF